MLNILKIIKNIFGINSNSNHDYTIMRLSDTLNIPSKNAFINCTDMYERIDNYIEEFNQLLKKKIIFTADFNNLELNKELNMLISLTTKIFVNEREKLFEEKSEMKKMILLKKFELYLSDIQNKQNDIMCRLVALTELKSKEVLSKKKRDTIEQEIENLTISMLTCMNQKEGILSETESYKTILQNLKIENINKDELETYYKDLKENASKILHIDDIDIMTTDLYTKIAILEKRVESYFYKNIEYIKILSSRIENAENKRNQNNFEGLIDEIEQLEQNLIFYEKYGKDLDENLKIRLYKLKFDVVANDYNLFKSPLLEKGNSEEAYDIYSKEVEKRIEDIIRGNNSTLQELFVKENANYVISSLKNIFTKDSGNFDIKYILSNIYLLQLLVALDSEEKMIKWFKRIADREEFLGVENNVKYFENQGPKWGDSERAAWISICYKDKLPIETICNRLSIAKDNEQILPLIILYKLLREKYFSNIKKEAYYVPEGIEYINTNNRALFGFPKEEAFSSKIIGDMKGKYVVFPKSLKKIAFTSYNTAGIKFQEGVEEIYLYRINSKNSNSIKC